MVHFFVLQKCSRKGAISVSCGGVDATHAEDRRNLIRQISGIATNINQMSKHCNESKWFGNADVLKMTYVLEDVLKLLKQLIESWR